jgi:peroxiredoxin
MLPIGTSAPPFNLFDTVEGRHLSSDALRGVSGTVVMFLCNHCPYVLHVNAEIVRIAKEYMSRGVSFVGISSNDVEAYPEDGPDKMREQAREVGYPFPYLFDADQSVAKAYDAACTPDFYVFDGAGKLFYRGQLDDSRPNRNPVAVTGSDLRGALAALLRGDSSPTLQRPSGGCNIKWKN